MEVSFNQEIKSLRLGAGDTFHGEGILAIIKAMLRSGVSYVGGYQGAPVSDALSNLSSHGVIGGARAAIDGESFGALIRDRKIKGD